MRSAYQAAALIATFTSLGAHAAPLTTSSIFWGERSAWSGGEFPVASDDVNLGPGLMVMSTNSGGVFAGQARVVSGPQTQLEIGSSALSVNSSLNAARLQTDQLSMYGGLLAIRGAGPGFETDLGTTTIRSAGTASSTMTVVRQGTIRFGATTDVNGSLRLGGLGSFANSGLMTVRNNQVDFDRTGGITLEGEASLFNGDTLALEGPASILARGFPVRFVNSGVLTASDPDALGLPALIEPEVYNTQLIEVTSGTLRLANGAVHDGRVGGFGNLGRMSVSAGGTLELRGTHEILGSVGVTGDGRVELGGAFATTPSFMLITKDATLITQGTQFFQSAEVGVDGTLHNPSTGTYYVFDTLSLGPDGTVRQEGFMQLAGKLENRGGRSIVAATGSTIGQGSYTQFSGNTMIEAAGTLDLTFFQGQEGSFRQNDGSTTVDGLLRAGLVEFLGGSVGGSGIIEYTDTLSSAVTFGAGLTVQPGNSPGVLTINGNLEAAGAIFDIEVAGLDPGVLFDQLVVNGDANLTDATVNFRFLDGFLPTPGDTFNWLVVSGFASGLDTLAVSFFSDAGTIGGFLQADGSLYVDSVTPIPLPPAAWALGSALLGLGAAARRRSASVSPA